MSIIENVPAVQVSEDRGGCVIKLIAQEGFTEYKTALSCKKDFVESAFIESVSAAVCPEGYCCIAKGKLSIKDYICGGGTVDTSKLCRLADTILFMAERCRNFDIPLTDMIFDYSAVFTDKAFSEIKFVYMPGAWTAQKPGCCGELIKIVFLHMYGELPAEEYRLMGHAIDTLCVETEYDGLLCGIRNLRLRLQQYNLNKKTSFYNKLCELVKKTVASVREGEADEKEDGKIVSRNKKCSDPGESLERCLCTERYVELIGEEKLEGSYVRKNFKKERRVFIKIGRDKEWSDLVVNDIFASRRHAELQIDRDGYMSINDMSLNGVGISGDKKSPDNEISIINSDIKIFITENCRVLVRYKTGTA